MISLFLFLSCAPKQAALSPEPYPANEIIPTSPVLDTGTLQNGLQYYIRENNTPNNRAELRLVIRAGSVLEDQDQLGLAHFLEHMAFNGSKNFPGTSLIDFMESLGMRFGAHLNAYTGFDQTVYQLTIPTDNPVVIDRSLAVLKDQGFHLLFDPQEVEKERGVVLEEWRQSLGTSSRVRDQLLDSTFAGSKYKDRLPIGTEESLKTFKHEALKRFYTDWYRPDLMAIIAVGDFDSDEVEDMIKKHFDSIPKAKNHGNELILTFRTLANRE